MALPKINLSLERKILLWGISSNFAPHRLCWLMNKKMNWNIQRIDDVVVRAEPEDKPMLSLALEQKSEWIYPNYWFQDESLLFEVKIIYNRAESEAFLTELKQMDYLVVVSGELELFPKDFGAILKSESGISSAMQINLSKLRNTNRLHYYIG